MTLLKRLLHPLGFALLAFVLTLPSLSAGIGGDDYFHRMVLLGRGELGAKLDPTFDFFSFVPDRHRDRMAELGLLPWWSDPHMRGSLGRPLSALTHQLDYALWPDNFELQHLHSLLWFSLGVGLAALLFRRVHGDTAAAGLASLLFAVEDTHAVSASWLASRNALLCLVFGTLTILGHLSWRETGRRSHLLMALLALTIGLGCGEATIGALAYVAAWQLTDERRSWTARLFPLAPYAIVVIIWRGLYNLAGYGAESALYIDPGRDPLRFLENLIERWPLLFSAQWLHAPIGNWLLGSRAQQAAEVALTAVASALVLALLFNLLREQRLARFWSLGMALSLIPACAAIPASRLLVITGIGAFGVMALFIQSAGVWPWQRGAPRRFRFWIAIPLLALHLPVAAFLLVSGASQRQVRHSPKAGMLSATGGEALNQTFIYVNGRDFLPLYEWYAREAEGDPISPRRVALLSSMLTTQTIRREGSATLVIDSAGGHLRYPADRLLGGPLRTFAKGERIERPDYVVEIRSVTTDRRPQEVAFHFRRDLEDPSYRWLCFSNGRLAPFTVPESGDSVTLRGSIE